MRSVFKSPMTERVSPKHRLLADRAARQSPSSRSTMTTTGRAARTASSRCFGLTRSVIGDLNTERISNAGHVGNV